jgi:hypothetical protein
MLRIRRRQCLFLAAAAAGMAISACSDRSRQTPETAVTRAPDATIEMQEVQVAFIGSGGGGSGVLHFRGRDYPIRVLGLGVGGIGASTIEAHGEVYNLSDVSRLAGTYGRARYGYALGSAGSGEMWMENEAGVVMRLRAKREGLMLSLGGDAMVISMQ